MSITMSSQAPQTRPVHRIDPLNDKRWIPFVEKHPRASMFHSFAWLRALEQTYGYGVVAYTTSEPGEDLENAIVLCQIESWLTGRRLVSMPFSDHCEPLVDRQDDLNVLAAALEQELWRDDWRYLEVRPLTGLQIATSLSTTTVSYSFHQLDLRPELNEIYRNFHKNAIKSQIRRAEREDLKYNEGSSDWHLDRFYRLFTMTRRRHRVPPQPRKWFENLMSFFGDSLKIRLALKDDRPVAGMLTIRHKDTLVYKYGCSDSRCNNLGGMAMLFWTSIKEAKAAGLRMFDLGRSDVSQTGLITFKNRWGASESVLTYFRYERSANSTRVFDLPISTWKSAGVKEVLAHLPASILSVVGRTFYKHVG